MGGIIGALIGRHMAHEEEKRDLAFRPVQNALDAFEKDPVSGPITPEQYMEAINVGMKLGRIGKEAKVYGQDLARYAARQREIQAMNDRVRFALDAAPKVSGTPPWKGSLGPQQPQASMMRPEQAQTLQETPQNPFMPQASPGLLAAAKPAQSPAQAAPQQGLPQPPGQQPPGPSPFPSGAGGNAPEPAPDPMAQAAARAVTQRQVGGAKSGTGFGGPQPQLPEPPGGILRYDDEPQKPFWIPRSPSEMAVRAAEAQAAGTIAGSRAMSAYAMEQLANLKERLRIMGIDPSTLTVQQLDAVMNGKPIPETKFHNISQGQTAIADAPGGGRVAISGGDPMTTVNPGQTASGSSLPPAGTQFNIGAPGASPAATGGRTAAPFTPVGNGLGSAMSNPPAGTPTAQRVVSGGPPLRSDDTREAIDAYTAMRKESDPSYTFSDRDMNAAIAARRLATAPQGEQAQAAFVRSLETELGRRLTDRELAMANIKYQGMLAEGRETADTKAMRAVAAQLAQLRVDELQDRIGPEAMRDMAKAWQLGMPPRNGRDADRVVRWAVANDVELPVPLSPQALAIVREAQPKLDMLRRVKEQLEPFKNEKTPGTTTLNRLAYALGYGNDTTKLLTELEMSKITGAATILKGSSRSLQALQQGMIHTPNAWHGSGNQQYDQVEMMERALVDIIHDAKMYGLKSGVIVNTPGSPSEAKNPMTNPPAGITPGGVPSVGSTFNGGKVLKVTPVK